MKEIKISKLQDVINYLYAKKIGYNRYSKPSDNVWVFSRRFSSTSRIIAEWNPETQIVYIYQDTIKKTPMPILECDTCKESCVGCYNSCKHYNKRQYHAPRIVSTECQNCKGIIESLKNRILELEGYDARLQEELEKLDHHFCPVCAKPVGYDGCCSACN